MSTILRRSSVHEIIAAEEWVMYVIPVLLGWVALAITGLFLPVIYVVSLVVEWLTKRS